MMKHIKFLILFTILSSLLFAQNLTDIKICIDPGHGGHESDDRYMASTGFWESESNLTKAKYLELILEEYGCEIILTRTGNGNNYPDDLSLSQRVAVANSNNADMFHSIHSNGYNGQRNSTLMLFQGWDNDPTWDESKVLSDIMVVKLFNAHRTTGKSVRGDFNFYGTGQAYLGVLKNLQMPGTLSEGSFHDYIPESWRLQNLDYRKHESWAILRSFIEYYETDNFNHGIIAGCVKDIERSVDYNYLTGRDKWLPINNFTATLQPGNLVYTGDKMNNGFFMFDRLEPGDYTLYFDATFYNPDSISVTVEANKTVFADKLLKSDSTYVGEPEVPGNIHFIITSPTSITAKCNYSIDASGYRVYYGTNPSSLSSYVESDTSVLELTELSSGSIYYFTIKSFNDIGESLDSDITYAAIPAEDGEKILIVNGFERDTNTSHNYIRKYAYHFKSLDLGFSYALNECIYDGNISLNDYKTVVWILGDESSIDDTFNSVEQDSIISFLRNGGNLLVSGSEIGWDLEGKSNHATQKDKDFYHNFLKAKYEADAPNNSQSTYYVVDGIDGKIFGGLTGIKFDDGTHGTIDVDWPDIISPVNGSIGCMKFQDVPTTSGFAGVSYEGLFPGGHSEGKLVHLTIPFETIYPTSKRQDVMEKVMDYFQGNFTALGQSENKIVNDFKLYDNYPNPFNPSTTISFHIPKSSPVKLEIYDINGNLVETLIDKDMNSGLHTTIWDATEKSSGVYFYILKAGNFTSSQKCILMK